MLDLVLLLFSWFKCVPSGLNHEVESAFSVSVISVGKEVLSDVWERGGLYSEEECGYGGDSPSASP